MIDLKQELCKPALKLETFYVIWCNKLQQNHWEEFEYYDEIGLDGNISIEKVIIYVQFYL